MFYVAIQMLLGDRVKWYGVILGVFLCTFLIMHMLGMFSGMMERTYALISDIPEADIWVMDPAVQYVDEPIGLSDNALLRVRGVHGVEWATPLFVSSLHTRLPNGAFQAVQVIGVDDASLVGLPHGEAEGNVDDLRVADRVFIDAIGARTLLAMPTDVEPWSHDSHEITYTGARRPLVLGDELLVNDHRVVVAGIVDLGPRFLSKPVLYTTYTRALEMSPKTRSMLSFVLVKASPGVAPADLAERLTAETGLRARTARQFESDTYRYYLIMTGVVARILFLVCISVIVGVSVSSVLFYLFTSENARYYATLKALGASNLLLLGMVVVQTFVGTATGYGLGLGVSAAMGRWFQSSSMPYAISWWLLGLSAGAVVFVGMVASVLSAKRVLTLEAAMVFK